MDFSNDFLPLNFVQVSGIHVPYAVGLARTAHA